MPRTKKPASTASPERLLDGIEAYMTEHFDAAVAHLSQPIEPAVDEPARPWPYDNAEGRARLTGSLDVGAPCTCSCLCGVPGQNDDTGAAGWCDPCRMNIHAHGFSLTPRHPLLCLCAECAVTQ